MKNEYRTLVSLSTVLPISIPMAYVLADDIFVKWPDCLKGLVGEMLDPTLVIVVLAIFVNFIFGSWVVKRLRSYADEGNVNEIIIERVRPVGADSLMVYFPYVLPLFISQTGSQGIFGWLLGLILLIVLSWVSMTIAYSPLLRIFGVRFYEAELCDKRTVMLLIVNKNLDPVFIRKAVNVSLFCRIGVE